MLIKVWLKREILPQGNCKLSIFYCINFSPWLSKNVQMILQLSQLFNYLFKSLAIG